MDFSSLSMLMASHPHCLRRFYHARAVTGRKYHCEVHRHQPIQPARCTCCMSIDRSPFARVVAYLLLSRFPITYRNAALFDYQGTKKGLTGFPARSDLRSHGCERADDAAKHVRIRAYHRFLKLNQETHLNCIQWTCRWNIPVRQFDTAVISATDCFNRISKGQMLNIETNGSGSYAIHFSQLSHFDMPATAKRVPYGHTSRSGVHPIHLPSALHDRGHIGKNLSTLESFV